MILLLVRPGEHITQAVDQAAARMKHPTPYLEPGGGHPRRRRMPHAYTSDRYALHAPIFHSPGLPQALASLPPQPYAPPDLVQRI